MRGEKQNFVGRHEEIQWIDEKETEIELEIKIKKIKKKKWIKIKMQMNEGNLKTESSRRVLWFVRKCVYMCVCGWLVEWGQVGTLHCRPEQDQLPSRNESVRTQAGIVGRHFQLDQQ